MDFVEFYYLILISTAIAAIIFTLLYQQSFNYWKNKNVPFIRPKFPFGNIDNIFFRKKALYENVADVYNEIKSQGHKHAGFYSFNAPVYLPISPELTKNILSKDFEHFINRGFYHNEEKDPLSAHMFAIENEKWRKLRTKVTPTFSSGKIKAMFKLVSGCAEAMVRHVEGLSGDEVVLDIRELMAKYSTDVIGTCAFGIDCNSFKNPDAEFRTNGRKLFQMGFKMKLKAFIMITFPKLAHYINMRVIPSDISKFFFGVTERMVELREEKSCEREDFMQLLIKIKNSPEGLTFNELTAHAFFFFNAGFETSSTTLTFCMYELAHGQDIQDRLRREICDVLKQFEGEISYESIQHMKYLDQTIKETLRKYPPIPMLNRVCTKAYNIPNTDIVLEKGTKVMVPTYGIQHDPEYYPDPETFNPDRFSDENKHKLVPNTYLPFGDGPRYCIGMRFGLMQVKLALVLTLRTFKLRLESKYPFQCDAGRLMICNVDPIYLNFEKI